jgi:hypothetical protein
VQDLVAAGLSPSPALTNDAQNLYVSAAIRIATNGSCSLPSAFFCASGYPFATYVTSTNSGNYIPPGDSVLLTERGYVQTPTTNPPPFITGPDPAHLEPPYVLYNVP